MPEESVSESGTSEAGSGVGSRRTAANAERDNVFNRTNADIGVDEGYQLAGLDSTRGWNANAKLTYDNVLQGLAAQVAEAQTHIVNVNAVRLQTLATMQANADALTKQMIKHSDVAHNRTWTQVDEMGISAAAAFASLNAKTGSQADALQALALKILSDAASSKPA